MKQAHTRRLYASVSQHWVVLQLTGLGWAVARLVRLLPWSHQTGCHIQAPMLGSLARLVGWTDS